MYVNDIEFKANLVKFRIEEDFKGVAAQDLESFFDKFEGDSRTLSFIKYYNKTVLDKEKIKFSEFSYQWALHLPRNFYTYFDENYNKLINEIIDKRDIESFYKSFCTFERKEGSFCSKLFHTILPSEFPPVDNPIRKRFKLQKEEFISSVLIIKRGYELFIKENTKILQLIRDILHKSKFNYLRINELSDIRILDMYYWFKESRENRNKCKSNLSEYKRDKEEFSSIVQKLKNAYN